MDRRTSSASALGAALAVAAALAGCALPAPAPTTGAGLPPQQPTRPPPAPAAPPPKLVGSSWYWLGTLTPAGLVAPADPGGFNVEFLDGGQLAAQLDCNSGGATWTQSGASLTVGPVRSTRKACPLASEADRFGRQLPLVRAAILANGLLELSLGEAGSMVMARDPDWRLRSFDCPNGVAPLLVAFGRDQAVLRWRGEAWQMKAQTSASGTRYNAGNAILFSKGNEASLVNEGRQVAGPCTARR
ncbi:MAG: MliC family protein [Burkholderiales bacterium]|jgi:heat shock protein HslJ